ncbi:MAG TPA: universal stress protein [Fimbriiglobus sp.]|nr:universal stress protein [Fimbriiglobus sp.]
MFRTVLVPLDGSPSAEYALPWALAAAGPNAGIHLVHVHVAPVPMMVEGVVVADPNLDQSIREQEGDYMAHLAERVRVANPNLSVTARTIDSDSPLAEAIGQSAEEAEADLVVMTTHGRGPFARFWLGSVSDEFLRHSPVPTLVLRPRDDKAPANLAAKPTLRHLIIPLDGSELAERVVAPAVGLATRFGADVTLVLVLGSVSDSSVVPRIKRSDPADATTPAERAELYLDRLARAIAEQGGMARTKLIREGSPSDVVLGIAGNDPASGIALATHGRSGITRLLMGSVADDVVRHAPGPVLVFHPE